MPSANSEHLSLERVIQTAREVAGDQHHFKVVQLPFNLAMIEALNQANQSLDGQKLTFLEAASKLGITVMCSASLLQSQLTTGLPPVMSEVFARLRTEAQRAIQFTRSTPGVITALVGMSQAQHVKENLALAATSPAPAAEFMKLFEQR